MIILSASRGIFLELGAHLLLGEARALRVRLEPPRPELVAHVAAQRNLLPPDAEQLVDQAIRTRAAEVEPAFGCPVRDPADYDLILNSRTLDLFHALDLVVQAYEVRFTLAPGWWADCGS